MQKSLSLLLMVASPIAMNAEQAPAKDHWSEVESLKPGVEIYVRTDTRKLHCAVTQVDDQGLACTSGKATVNLARAEIKTVAVRHLGRSTLIGLTIGAAGGAILGAAIPSDEIFTKGSLIGSGAAGFGLLGAIVGATSGAFPKTIYHR